MASTYIYSLCKATEFKHFIASSENECGIQAYIIKDCKIVQEEFSAHASIVDLLYADRSPDVSRDVVFLQVSPKGKCFASYSEEPNKLCMTLGAYLDLLKFFQKDFVKLVKKIDYDTKIMSNRSEWMSYNSFLSFRGPADIAFKHIIQTSPDFSFELCINKEYKKENLNAQLEYSYRDMGAVNLPIPTIKTLALDLPVVSDLVSYKESGTSRRHRQS